ncbi:hypothetical protein RF11_09184 [Thelohanellus kitauei]|uniref:Uncharacterized protein n=1 Tax=Thelohanellus kitauei TaxID=669202 RepID=A0A0C2J062_THEKT|nr:hypothetical protein RF11_09184 [Thelohanellus kitauei]
MKSPCPTSDVLSNVLDQHELVKPMYLLSLCYSEQFIEFARLILDKAVGLEFVNLDYYLALKYLKKRSLKSGVIVANTTAPVEKAREELDKAMESYIASFEKKRLGNINRVVKNALRSILKTPGESEKTVIKYIADHLEHALRNIRRQWNERWRDYIVSIDESISSSNTGATARPNTDSQVSISTHSITSRSVDGHGSDHFEIDTKQTSKNGSKNGKSDEYHAPSNPPADVSSHTSPIHYTANVESPRLTCL